ncbi:MAG: ABC transporter ATP-binding protein [Firmicutes bacterium]|nr:ABC transporter ATP-binding protein [Bacillota bacterium]
MAKLLKVKNVAYYYTAEGTRIRAVDGVSLSLPAGKALGLVGESGSGKSTLGKLIAGLLKPQRGCIYFAGERIEGKMLPSIQYVFQNSTAALNPRMRVKNLIEEGLIIQGKYRRQQRINRVLTALKAVGLPETLLYRFPHELSGGQKQRVAIARALIMDPRLLILDEPVSSLDVTAGARLLALLKSLRQEKHLAYILISHDLAVVRQVCDYVAVMYAGKIVERGKVEQIFSSPGHYYTKMLLSAHPSPDPKRRCLPKIIGEPVDPSHIPAGCRFHPRCPQATFACSHRPPAFFEITPGHLVACHRTQTQIF